MDITLDAGELYFGLNAAMNLEEELLNLSSAINSLSVSSELPSAAIFSNLKTSLVATINGDVNDLITRLENSKRILREYDEEAAMLFTFFDNGIINGDFEFTDMPLLDQTDYKNIRYSQGTVATSGCGITSVCMVASYFTGNLYTPEDLAAMANKSGSSNVDRMTWAADYVGLKWYCNENTSTSDLKQMLSEGKTVIILVKNSSHFVVCKGITEDGKILVNDPYGPWAKDEPYTLEELKMSCGKTWVFDPAENQHLDMEMDTTVTVEADVVELLQEKTAFTSRESTPGQGGTIEETVVDTTTSESSTIVNNESNNNQVVTNTDNSSNKEVVDTNTSTSTNTGSSTTNTSANTSTSTNTGSSTTNTSTNTSTNTNAGSSTTNTSANTSTNTNTGSSTTNTSANTSTNTNTGSSTTNTSTNTSINVNVENNSSEVLDSNVSTNTSVEENVSINNENAVVPESNTSSDYNVPSTNTSGTVNNSYTADIEILDEPIPNTDAVGLATSPSDETNYNDYYEVPTDRDVTVEIPAGSDSTTTTKKNDLNKYIVPGIAGTAVVGAAVTYGALKNKVNKSKAGKYEETEESEEEYEEYSVDTEEL